MRISDWSSDVCSSDLGGDAHESELIADADTVQSAFRRNMFQSVTALLDAPSAFERFKDALTTNPTLTEIGRASCRESGCPYVSISVVAVSLQKKNNQTPMISM